MREKLIRILGNSKKSVWELIESWNSDLNSFLKTLEKAYRDKLIFVENEKVFLNKKYEKLVKPRLKVKVCEKCKGSMINFDEKKLLREFLKIVKNRPKLKIKYFQGWMKPEEVIKRICLMDYFDGIADKSIVLIGDDDLVSIALGLTNLPKRILALEGELGGGKTTFLKGFAKGLGIKERILSPTFILIRKFKISDSKFKNFYHIDCYRIEKEKEILKLGFKEIVKNSKNIVAIEWSDKIKNILPSNVLFLKFEILNAKKRNINISFSKKLRGLKNLIKLIKAK